MATATAPFTEADLDHPARNVKWRRYAYKRAEKDLKFRKALINRARRDVIFFLKAFAWIEEPRAEREKFGRTASGKLPFIPWPHQIPVILKIHKHLGHDDIVVEKSRDEGMSWIGLLLAVRDWLFVPSAKIGLVSSTKDLADKFGDMGALLSKIDWELEEMPEWLTGPNIQRLKGGKPPKFGYRRNIQKSTLLNLRTRAMITAIAGGPDIFRGDRLRWVLADEMASKLWLKSGRDYDSLHATSKATDCRLMISTPSGPVGAYYDVVHGESNVVRVQIRWSDNPTKNRGLYRMNRGIPVAVDPENNPLPPEYDPPSHDVLAMFGRLRARGFNLNKGLRSPWKDRECLRPAETPQSEARELDLDYSGAMDPIFGDSFRSAVVRTEKRPLLMGHFSVNDTLEKWEFDRQDGAPFWLWCPLDHKNRPPGHDYLVACDSATGEGGAFCSNSVLTIVDLVTREQVGEFASKTIGRGAFADFAIGVCKWFNGAYLAWEHGGPGTGFTKRVLKRGYPHYFRRVVNWKSSTQKKSQEAGWVATTETKPAALDELKMAVLGGDLIVRSIPFRQECEQYVQKGDSEQHVASKDRTHADRVIALTVAVQAMKDKPAPQLITNGAFDASSDVEPPEGTFAHLLWQEKKLTAPKTPFTWDPRSQADMARSLSHAG